MIPRSPAPRPDPGNAVELRSLSHNYGSFEALRNLTLSVRFGEVFGFLGPNGGGKSTLFRILSTQMKPTGGAAFVFGQDVTQEPSVVRRMLGVVFQSPSLDKKLTAAENMLHQGHLYGLSGNDLHTRISAALDLVGLIDRANDRVEKLSGGMQRRVEVAKALLHEPRLLLLDEPSTGLDLPSRSDLMARLRSMRDDAGVTCLLTTHLLEEAEKCDRLAIIDRGQIVALGTPDELKAKCGGEVLVIDSREPKRLQHLIDQQYKVQPTVLGQSVRIELPSREAREADVPSAPELLTRLSESFGKYIQSARVGPPSLEDVFVRATGRSFDTES